MTDAGVFNQEAFFDYIDQIVDEWIDYGQIHEDENTEGLKELARNMWEEIQELEEEKADNNSKEGSADSE